MVLVGRTRSHRQHRQGHDASDQIDNQLDGVGEQANRTRQSVIWATALPARLLSNQYPSVR
jgi:hypothetical protein